MGYHVPKPHALATDMHTLTRETVYLCEFSGPLHFAKYTQADIK